MDMDMVVSPVTGATPTDVGMAMGWPRLLKPYVDSYA